MGKIRALGYLVATATDLPAWKTFASDVHGMQVVEHTEERLLLRLDDRSWRIDVRAGDEDRVQTYGWEAGSAEDLDELEKTLTVNGFPTRRGTAEEIIERRVTDLLVLNDPDGTPVEIFYGQKREHAPFVSPTGARFVTGDLGLGHVMLSVSDSHPFRRLYMDLLGLALSDYIDLGPDPGTFLHCNRRHHSLAFTYRPEVPLGVGHLMVQVENVDTVGRAYDKVLDGAAPLGSTLGKHTNDEMISYYVKTPSGWEMEYGYGGLEIDVDTWVPGRWDAAHFWGHKRGKLIGTGA